MYVVLYWFFLSSGEVNSRISDPAKNLSGPVHTTCMHSCQVSRFDRDSPGILGYVPVVSRLRRLSQSLTFHTGTEEVSHSLARK